MNNNLTLKELTPIFLGEIKSVNNKIDVILERQADIKVNVECLKVESEIKKANFKVTVAITSSTAAAITVFINIIYFIIFVVPKG